MVKFEPGRGRPAVILTICVKTPEVERLSSTSENDNNERSGDLILRKKVIRTHVPE